MAGKCKCLRVISSPLCLSLLCALCVSVVQCRAGDDLAERLEGVMNRAEYKQARWGVLVVDSKSGKVVYEQNADRLFIPASTTKLYSCAAALDALGSDYRFKTPVYERGKRLGGVLKG